MGELSKSTEDRQTPATRETKMGNGAPTMKLPPNLPDRMSAAEFQELLKGTYQPKTKNMPKLRTNPRKDFATYKDGVLTIVIHELPTSYNQRKNWHWTTERDEKARWEEIIWGVCLEIGRPKFNRPIVQVNFYFPDNRRRDPADNYMSWKALTDGLTKAGVIPDDSWQYAKVLAPEVEIDKKNPRTEIIVRE